MINDNHDIDKQWQEFKKIYEMIEPDLYKFLGKSKNKMASERVRACFNELRLRSRKIRKSILMQRKDNDADYENRNI